MGERGVSLFAGFQPLSLHCVGVVVSSFPEFTYFDTFTFVGLGTVCFYCVLSSQVLVFGGLSVRHSWSFGRGGVMVDCYGGLYLGFIHKWATCVQEEGCLLRWQRFQPVSAHPQPRLCRGKSQTMVVVAVQGASK